VISGELGFFTVLDGLLTDVTTVLATTTGGKPERVTVYPGLIAWDECDCGLLAGAVQQVFFSDDFPVPQGSGQPLPNTACAAGFIVAQMVISVVRCAPTPNENEVSPTVMALTNAARVWTVDAHWTRHTVACRLQEMKDADEIVDYVVNTQTPVGPEGGCVGSDIMFTVGLENR
jgi:hypothetical protein